MLISYNCKTTEKVFKRQDYKTAYRANARDMLKDSDLRQMLLIFLIKKQGRSNLKSETRNIVECYELCELIWYNEEDINSRWQDLEDACFTNYFVERLHTIETNAFLDELMSECIRRLSGEMDAYEFIKFREMLEKKLSIK